MKADILLLDVDGVVTDRYARVSTPVLRELERLLRSGVKIAFVTGRSETWVKRNLTAKFRGKNDNVLFLCEFGSVVVGKKTDLKRRAMPARYVGRAKEIAGSFPAMEYDYAKKTMISMEADMSRPGAKGQLVAAEKLLCLMVARDKKFRVLKSTYAVDVLRRNVGKRNAVLLAMKKFGGKKAVIIGDSAADLEMILPGCVFYFVGWGRPRPRRKSIKFVVTRKKFSDGALSVLKKLK